MKNLKQRSLITAILIGISLILISFISCKTTKQDIDDYVKNNPAILSEICPKPVTIFKRDTVIKHDTIIEIQFFTDTVNHSDTILKQITKFITKTVTIHDSINIIDSTLYIEARDQIIQAEKELKKKDDKIIRVKSQRNTLAVSFLIFIIIAAAVVYSLLRKRS